MIKVVAQITTETEDGYTRSVGVPTFYLDCSFDSAPSVARSVLNPFDRQCSLNFGIYEESTDRYTSCRIECFGGKDTHVTTNQSTQS